MVLVLLNKLSRITWIPQTLPNNVDKGATKACTISTFPIIEDMLFSMFWTFWFYCLIIFTSHLFGTSHAFFYKLMLTMLSLYDCPTHHSIQFILINTHELWIVISLAQILYHSMKTNQIISNFISLLSSRNTIMSSVNLILLLLCYF